MRHAGSGTGSSRKAVWWIVGSLVAIIVICTGGYFVAQGLGSTDTPTTSDTGSDTGGGTDPGSDTSSPPEDPPEDPVVDCWDGSTASGAASCPPLEGLDAMAWVVGAYDGAPITDVTTCTEELVDAGYGQQERWYCPIGTSVVYLTRYTTPEDAAAFLSTRHGSTTPNEGATLSHTWTGCQVAGYTCVALSYDEREFTQEVIGADPAEVEAVYFALLARTESEIAAAAPY